MAAAAAIYPAIAEENHVVECLRKVITDRTTLEAFAADTLAEAVRKFDLRPEAVLVPIEYMTPIMRFQLKGIRLTRRENEEFLSIDGIGLLPVIWSLVYLQFKEVILLERALGEWLVNGARSQVRTKLCFSLVFNGLQFSGQ